MKKDLSELMCELKKPAFTLGNRETGKFCTVSALGVGIIMFLIAFHVCAWKCHSMCACKKGKKEALNGSEN